MKGSPEVSSYDDLFGNDSLRRALENHDGSSLEAIWRLRQPAAAQAVVEPLVSLGLPRLSDLLLEEVLERSLGDQVASDIQSAVRQHNPALTTQGIERLAEWLRDNEPQEGPPASAREVLEVWLRGEKTELTHTGDQPTEEDETTAWSCFSESAKIMVNILDQD